MGSVFEAAHETSKEKVAVKLIAAHVADEPRFRRRFAAEVETLKRLRHNGIVRLIGYGEQEGQLFYSMEMVEGESLQQRIQRLKKIDYHSTMDIAIEVCAALKHAHDVGVIHRDLKPSNLIISKQGKVKLVDFGIAKLFGFGEQTLAGSVLGTADYMAPEQADGSGITVRTDLYALGSLMYAMLTGRPPFPGKRATEVIRSLRTERPASLDLIDPDLPLELVELVHQLLEKKPENRPPTALSVMNRLKAMKMGLHHQKTLNESSHQTAAIEHDFDELKSNGSDGTQITEISQVDLLSGDSSTLRSVQPKNKASFNPTIASKNTDITITPEEQQSRSLNLDLALDLHPLHTDTRFETVDSDHIATAMDRPSDLRASDLWKHALSISIMGAVLVAGVVLILRAVRQPTADELHNQILSIISTSGPVAAQNEITQFLKQFPEDKRFEEIQSLDRTMDLERMLRRFTVQAKLGITPLAASEQGFLDAMRGREQEPLEAQERIEQWLAIYATDTLQTEASLKQMIVLAEHELAQLSLRAPAILIDPRASELLHRIRETVDKAPAETAVKTLHAIIELHHDQQWAEPAVAEAKRLLETIAPKD